MDDTDAEEWDSTQEGCGGGSGRSCGAIFPPPADRLVREAGGDPARRCRAPARGRSALVEVLARYPSLDRAGYKKAEVTGGGVALSEVDPHVESDPPVSTFAARASTLSDDRGYNFLWGWRGQGGVLGGRVAGSE